MASSYALPLNSTSETHHAHSRSNFLSDRPPSWISQVNSASSVKKAPATTANGAHNHSNSEHNRHLHNLEIPSYTQNHNHTHSHSTPVESTFDSRSAAMGRRRGESDLSRPPTRKSNAVNNLGFSPIEEVPAAVPPPAPLLALPEALTAILIPLPFIFASMAYPIVTSIPIPQKFHSGVADSTDKVPEVVLPSSPILHACALSSATLILVGIISKLCSSQQTLDRRKPGKAGHSDGELLSVDSLVRVGSCVASVLLPFYAAMQLGGTRVAIVLLTAVAAGFGSLDHRPVKHSILDMWKRTIRTRKFTSAILVLGIICDFLDTSANYGALLFGHLALVISVLVIAPPLPTTGMPLMTSGNGGSNGSWNPQASSRLSLPKPTSPLNASARDITITLAAGASLATLTIIASLFSFGSLSFSSYAVFSLLSVASATALILFSAPPSLRTPKKYGLAVGSALVGAFGLFGVSSMWKGLPYIPALCALSFAAVLFDTPSTPSHQHAHSNSHDHGHKHSPSHKHDHHLHGNHSRLSAFLIRKCTPGSITHSILLEKDSRRIAYFGVLNLSFMLVQFFYGFVSGSLGLLTDSIHMLFDCAGLAVGLAAAVMSKWHPNMRFPYGYGKIDTLSGFANGIFLMLVSVEIVFDAFERLWEGHELHRLNELLIVSILGFLVNIVGLTAFGHAHHGHGHDHGHDHGDHDGHSHGHSHSHDNENMQGIFLHILADALGSVAVIISTLLTKYYGWSGWDPIASCIIAVLIFFSALPLVKSSAMRLLLSLPADLEYGTRNTLQELSSLRGVVGYTVPRFWLEDAGAAHAEVHKNEKHEHGHGHEHGSDCHDHHSHDHGHDHSHGHDHEHEHSHSHNHSHHHSPASHHHDHSAHSPQTPHGVPPGQQKVLGVIHVIAARNADLEDVRERTEQFLKGRNMCVVVHVEREGEGRCWCGGGVKT